MRSKKLGHMSEKRIYFFVYSMMYTPFKTLQSTVQASDLHLPLKIVQTEQFFNCASKDYNMLLL